MTENQLLALISIIVIGVYLVSVGVVGLVCSPKITNPIVSTELTNLKVAIANKEIAEANTKITTEVITETAPAPIKTTAEVIKECIAQDLVQTAAAEYHILVARDVEIFLHIWSYFALVTLGLATYFAIIFSSGGGDYWIKPFYTDGPLRRITYWEAFCGHCRLILGFFWTLGVSHVFYREILSASLVKFNSWWYGSPAKELQVKNDMVIKMVKDLNAQERKIKLEAEIKLATKNHTKSLF